MAQVVKNPPANVRQVSSTPRLGRSPGEGNGNPFQYSCLGNPMDGGAWWATAHGVAKVKHDCTHVPGTSYSVSNLICNKGLEIVLTSKKSK